MTEKRPDKNPTLALSTRVEEEFIAPLAAIRGALEILRDYDDIGPKERQRFASNALRSCQRMERAVQELADTIYSAATARETEPRHGMARMQKAEVVAKDTGPGLLELDFSDTIFREPDMVNQTFDAAERKAGTAKPSPYILINLTRCRIWPEAWVAFSYRSKMLRTHLSTDMYRYDETSDGDVPADSSGLYPSRESALAAIEQAGGLASG